MSFGVKDLVALAGVPGLGAGVSLLTATYSTLENIKVYRQQCADMSARCVGLMVSLRDSSSGLEGHKAIEWADEITAIVSRADRKVNEWAALSRLKSFLQQREIKDGIDSLHRDIDAAMMRFNMQLNMGLTRGYLESKAIQERDKEEIREVLQKIIKSTDDMKALLSMQSSQPVEDIMESLQTELRDPTLEPYQERTFRAGLWLLHEKTSKLPPLTDLTGQVTLSSNHSVANGTFNDIFMGQWLDKEPVALRLPRIITNDPEVQRRLQREVTIWRSLKHPNVVQLYGIVYLGKDVYSVSPWMDNGTAIAYVQKHPDVDRLRILSEVAFGLEYLHLNGIVHGDLRGANVLISRDGRACLSDFGMSKFLEDCGQGMTSSPGVNPRWFAPELLQQTAPVSTHSDVWSFAMVCLELMTGEPPFSNFRRDISVLRELDKGRTPDRPGSRKAAQGFTDELWSLMKKCWNKKPDSRPSMSTIKEKLWEMRGIPPPGPMSPQSTPSTPSSKRRLSIFSVGRPSTSDSDASGKSSNSGHRLRIPFRGVTSGKIAEEPDQLSPISIPTAGKPVKTILNGSGSDPPTTRVPDLAVTVELDGFGLNPSPLSPQSGSQLGSPGPPRLELTNLSLHPPGARKHIYPERSPSEGSYSPSASHDSGSIRSGLLRETVADPRTIVNVDTSGTVISGTVEGLVERLIKNFNLRKDVEYRDILLTGCVDFTKPEDLFGILARRFHEAEANTNGHPEDKVADQYNIFMVIMYWLSNRHLQADPQLLHQMKNFCVSASSVVISLTMRDKAMDLLKLIDERLNRGGTDMLPLSPGRRIPKASQILPRDLAIALTLLEGDKYKAIQPMDYISHLRRHSRPNNVEAAWMVNNKVVTWVKQSVLHYDELEARTEVFKFFVNTAQECRKLRNFASTTAIANALHSSPIENLRLTRKGLSPYLKDILDELDDLLEPAARHRAYRAALNEGTISEIKNACIPWLAVHLLELHAVLQLYPTTIEVDGRRLINFKRYVKFMDRIKEVLHYIPPEMEHYRYQGQLAYLEHQLSGVYPSNEMDEELMERSRRLEMGETRDYRTRKRELRRLGFKAY